MTCILVLNWCCCVSHADDGIEFFEDKIETVLMDRCYKCHSEESDEPAGGLLLDSKAGIRRGGETGPAVVPEDIDESLLISAIEYRDLEMPPNEKLDDEVIEDFRQWIKMGAPDPRSDDDDHSAVEEFTKSIQKMPELSDATDEALRKWRDERRKTFEQIYSKSPTEVSESVCRIFEKSSAAQVLPVAVSVSGFVAIPETGNAVESSVLARWAPLRKAQYEKFVESQEFRQRLLRLVVWQTSFMGQQISGQQADANSSVDCVGIVARYGDCRKACEGKTELLDHQKLNCVMLMGLTSRSDMIEQVKQGASLRTVFLEWSRWFERSSSQLVQRKDQIGWEFVDASTTDSDALPFPKLKLPSSAAEGAPPVSASLRRLFVQ